MLKPLVKISRTKPLFDRLGKELKRLSGNQILVWVSIFLLAGLLRLAFSTGMGRFDDILYANSARALTQGDIILTPILGAGRIGMYGPLALLYLLFGPSFTTTMAWPLLCSLITIFLLYKIVQLLGDSKAALLAALFWALHPLSIAYGTANLPDTVMAMVSAAALYTWLLARRKKGWAAAAHYLLCIFFLFWGFWTKQQIVITAGFLLLWSVAEPLVPRFAPLLRQVSKRPLFPALLGGALLGFSIFYYGSIQPVSFFDSLAVTSQDIFTALSTGPLFYMLFPFLVVVLIISIKSQEPSYGFVAAWFIFTFLALEWVSMSLNPGIYTPGPIRPISTRTLLILMLPFAAMAGLVLNKLVNKKTLSQTVVLVSVSVAAIVLLNRAEWIDKNLFLGVSSLAILLFVILGLAFPLISSTALSKHYIPLFFLVMGVSIINPLQKNIDYSYSEIAYFRNLESTADVLTGDPTFPVYFYKHEDRRSLNHLNFVSGYQLAPDPFDEMSGRMRLFADPANITENSFVVVFDVSFLDQVSPTWWEIAHFTQPPTLYAANPPQVHMYRVLSSEDAAVRLRAAQRAALELPTPETILDLFAAAINANDEMAAFAAYIELLAVDNSASQYEEDLVNLLNHNLDALSVGKPSLIDGSFVGNLENWDRSQADAAGLELNILNEGSAGTLHIASRSDSEVIPISQHVVLKPDTAYAFQAEIRSTGQIAALYWWSRGVEDHYRGVVPDPGKFTPLTFIFITPAWDQPQEVLLAPIVLQGKGEVCIRGVTLVELVGSEP